MASTSTPRRILDSHIHLWPATSANEDGHTWMTPSAPLTRPYLLSDYLSATSTSPAPVVGAVFIETDRRLTPVPQTTNNNDDEKSTLTRCAGPLDEIAWLRSLLETDNTAQGLLWALVPWAPFDAPPAAFRAYLAAAQRAAGPAAWARVRGWRYLVQGIGDEAAFAELVGSVGWVENLRECGRRGWVFDVGVDARSAGVWQVELVTDMVERVRREEGEGEEGGRVTFVLNHLCKPDMLQPPTATPAHHDAFARWSACLHRLAALPAVYMKLSGGFSEMPQQDASAPLPADQVLARMKPWLDVAMRCFADPPRLMFGSDWPVCNVRGPGERRAWRAWVDAVRGVDEAYALSDEQSDALWFGTAVEAYGLVGPNDSREK
ncbi:hypothetical protein HDK77DRAFT_483841 [Phyllosticta capitalensis]|uniref:Amidohydrolase-related domain-containing protein n=1 Tax=Phyllosticta capitalensis TaxID=121624 RepID=A0ABR1YGM7_9PEZI